MNLTNEIFRKSMHFALIIIPITYYQLGKWPSLKIFAAVSAVIILADYLRITDNNLRRSFNNLLGPILRADEANGKNLSSASFTAISACIIFLFFNEKIAITAFLVMIFADGIAPICSKNIKSEPFFEKSLANAMSFFITGIMVIISCTIFFDAGLVFLFFALFSLACATLVESRPSIFKVDDNLTVPLSFSIIMSFFDMAWNFI